MNKFFKKIISPTLWRDRIFSSLSLLATILMLISWLLSAQVEVTDSILPWHYTVYFGIDRVGPWWMVLIYATFGTIVWLVNSIIASMVYYVRRLHSYLILILTIVVEVAIVILLSALLHYIV